MKFMKDMNGTNCGTKLKKLAKFYFYLLFVIMIIFIVAGVVGVLATMASGNPGSALGILVIVAVYAGVLGLLAFACYLNMFATGNMVEVQEKQYVLLQDLYKKLYDDGVLNQNADDKLEF